jgi:hypothetical protein
MFHDVSQKTNADFMQDQAIYNQMRVLNNGYNPHGIVFNLVGVTRTVNPRWANGEDDLGKKRALRKGDYRTLNLYTQKSVLQGNDRYLGYCHYPTDVVPGSDAFFRDGCLIQFDTMPGFNAHALNTGKIAIHEVGHWFNLFHTFEGGCFGDGDGIADTPAQSSPSDGCPVGRDSCGAPGLDPIHNHMDYSDDNCRFHFTQGQVARIYGSWQRYRAGA